jgi:hypothetical protein
MPPQVCPTLHAVVFKSASHGKQEPHQYRPPLQTQVVRSFDWTPSQLRFRPQAVEPSTNMHASP